MLTWIIKNYLILMKDYSISKTILDTIHTFVLICPFRHNPSYAMLEHVSPKEISQVYDVNGQAEIRNPQAHEHTKLSSCEWPFRFKNLCTDSALKSRKEQGHECVFWVHAEGIAWECNWQGGDTLVLSISRNAKCFSLHGCRSLAIDNFNA